MNGMEQITKVSSLVALHSTTSILMRAHYKITSSYGCVLFKKKKLVRQEKNKKTLQCVEICMYKVYSTKSLNTPAYEKFQSHNRVKSRKNEGKCLFCKCIRTFDWYCVLFSSVDLISKILLSND